MRTNPQRAAQQAPNVCSGDTPPFTDLLRLPELFPFAFCITGNDLEKSSYFNLYREGGWEMVGAWVQNSILYQRE